jgi:DNA invertase Pin-like site-specific DNA recombinase
VRRQKPDNPDDGRNEAASRPSRRALADRLSPEDVKTIIDLRQGGTPTKDLAAKFEISARSVRRLLRKHGTRHSDRQEAAD